MFYVFLLLCSNAQLNGSTDVSVPQFKVWIKVFLRSDGGGIGGGCILESQVL